MFPHWKDVPKNKAFNNDQEEIDFKSFEEKIMNEFDLEGHSYLKENFYNKYNKKNNEKWIIDD